MAKTSEPTIIKKYANRRLYNTGTSTYVTLEDLAVMVKGEEDFVVYDAKSGEDITRAVLTQIIVEQEGKGGQNLLPITFLRQLIRFYGDSMQGLVPSYLEFSISSLTKEQEKLRGHMTEAFGSSALEAIEEQVKRNTEMFERAMKMFMPFGIGGAATQAGSDAAQASAQRAAPASSSDLDDLKKQLAAMQKKIDALGTDKS